MFLIYFPFTIPTRGFSP